MTSLLLAPVPSTVRTRLRLAVQPRENTAPLTRLTVAGAVALVGSLIAAYVFAQIGRAVFTVPREFDKFNFGGYGVLTAIGVITAACGWPLTQRLSWSPRWLYLRAAGVVSVVLLLPDVWLFTQPGNPAGPVITLIVMHLAIAVVTYEAMTRLASVRAAVAPADQDRARTYPKRRDRAAGAPTLTRLIRR